jgi:hypothetical protein
VTETESQSPAARPRRTRRILTLLVAGTLGGWLGPLLGSKVAYLLGRPNLTVTVFPSGDLGESVATASVWIESNGERPATNVVCTLSDCAPQQVVANVIGTEPPVFLTVELRPDGVTVPIPRLEPRQRAVVWMILPKSARFTEKNCSVTGDGVVIGPRDQRTSLILIGLFPTVALLLTACWMIARRSQARRAAMRDSPGDSAPAAG